MIRSADNHTFKSPADCAAGGLDSYSVVLGGGGARGLAHLGAMQAISEKRITVNRVVGVSMGALMAGLCAFEGDMLRARGRALEFLDSRSGKKLRSSISGGGGISNKSPTRRWSVTLLHEIKKKKALLQSLRSQSLLPSKVLRDAINFLIPDIDIRDLPTPLQIVTVDLHSGMRVVLTEGSLRRAIRASMSIPGVFPAVHCGDQWLSDIGAFDLVPCDVPPDERAVSLGNEGVIAVDVGKRVDELEKCDSAITAILRSQTLAEYMIRQQSLAKADVVIQPKLKQSEWFDFSDPESFMDAGYDAAHKALATIAVEVA
jgi:NTE family protein